MGRGGINGGGAAMLTTTSSVAGAAAEEAVAGAAAEQAGGGAAAELPAWRGGGGGWRWKGPPIVLRARQSGQMKAAGARLAAGSVLGDAGAARPIVAAALCLARRGDAAERW